jgi:DNA repair exonuclease SbcCD ATPase subunit
MRIKSVEVKNVKGIEELNVQMGAVTVISGENGTGKSSFLDALSDVFDGGHDPSLIRKGAKRASTRMILDNGTEITRVITQSTSSYDILAPDGKPVKSPKAFIEELNSGIGFDPIKFLAAKDKDQLEYVLKALPVSWDGDEIGAVLTKAKVEDADPKRDTYRLAHMDSLIDTLFEERTGVNRVVKELEGTISSLEKAVPTAPEGQNWEQVVAAAAHDLELLKIARNEAENAAEKAYNAGKADIDAQYQKALDELNQWKSQAMSDVGDTFRSRITEIANEFGPGIETKVAALEEHRTLKAQADKAAGALEQLANFKQRWRLHATRADGLTAAIEKLREIRKSKFDALPIDGLVIEAGKLLFNGVPFAHLNTAQQIIVACQLAALSVGKLGFMILDRAESLDDETWQSFKDGFAATDMQVLAARVTKGPRKVEIVQPSSL